MPDPWTFTVKFGDRPQCPGCARPLTNLATVAVLGWLWCVDCHNNDLAVAGTLIRILQKPWVVHHTLWKSGLRAYCPRDARITRMTIIEADIKLTE